jgi:hypothetical protein
VYATDERDARTRFYFAFCCFGAGLALISGLEGLSDSGSSME